MKRPNKVYFIFLLFFPLLLNVYVAQAQDFDTEELSAPEGGEAKAKAPLDAKAQAAAKDRKLKISFDDELVKGQQATPEADFIFTRAQFNYKRMIRLRENFIPEVKKGKDEFRVKH